jgi:protocatechuate 3,4-dioxygenase beta subunit
MEITINSQHMNPGAQDLKFGYRISRRSLLTRLASGIVVSTSALMFSAPGAFAEQLSLTPPLTEGPYYPDKLPLDTDNDLIIIGNSLTPAIGIISHISGRVLLQSGSPVRNATVEIWQCDAKQVYLNSKDSIPKAAQRDKNFQGFGTFLTSSTGEYRFRTIKPVQYPGRPGPHIHIKVKKGDRTLLTTQLFIRGFSGNAMDGVFTGIHDPHDRDLVQADFKPIKESKVGELAATFDIVLGRTPEDKE